VFPRFDFAMPVGTACGIDASWSEDPGRATEWVMSKIWDALKKAELEREPVIAAVERADVPRLLTAKQRIALEALLGNPTLSDAANVSGINQRTIERFLKTPAFAAAYHVASRTAFGESVLQLKAASQEAIGVLRTALKDPDALVRVRAAEAIINAATRTELAASIGQAQQGAKRRA
jgi:hypothetical protein